MTQEKWFYKLKNFGKSYLEKFNSSKFKPTNNLQKNTWAQFNFIVPIDRNHINQTPKSQFSNEIRKRANCKTYPSFEELQEQTQIVNDTRRSKEEGGYVEVQRGVRLCVNLNGATIKRGVKQRRGIVRGIANLVNLSWLSISLSD